MVRATCARSDILLVERIAGGKEPEKKSRRREKKKREKHSERKDSLLRNHRRPLIGEPTIEDGEKGKRTQLKGGGGRSV